MGGQIKGIVGFIFRLLGDFKGREIKGSRVGDFKGGLGLGFPGKLRACNLLPPSIFPI